MSGDKVRGYYDAFDEWARLESPSGIIEYERTLGILTAHLKPASRILDIGGGPGRYTIALARAGHRVCLADLSQSLLDIAHWKIMEHGVQEQVESISWADATDLKNFASDSFDAALALGPFYHLVRASDQDAAAREIARVLKPDGLLAAAFIPRLSALAGLIDRAAASADQVSAEVIDSVLRSGVFHNPSTRGFQEGFYPEPHELVDLFARHGIRVTAIVSTRGFAYGREAALLRVRQQQPELYQQLMDTIAATERDPAAVALGGHALYLGHKGTA